MYAKPAWKGLDESWKELNEKLKEDVTHRIENGIDNYLQRIET
jgi:hypothetical protein